eukprot:2706793-Rhodomonas_salina.1
MACAAAAAAAAGPPRVIVLPAAGCCCCCWAPSQPRTQVGCKPLSQSELTRLMTAGGFVARRELGVRRSGPLPEAPLRPHLPRRALQS